MGLACILEDYLSIMSAFHCFPMGPVGFEPTTKEL